jgi:hypothetical protein
MVLMFQNRGKRRGRRGRQFSHATGLLEEGVWKCKGTVIQIRASSNLERRLQTSITSRISSG